ITGAVALTDISSLKTANFGTAPSIAQNTQYLLTVIGSADFVFKCDATGGTDKQDWSNSYATPTNFNWDGGSNIKGSIYCTYEVAEENNAPTQSGEVPANTSTGISLTPICNVTANDADDGDTLTVTFYENTTDSWVLQQTNGSVSPGTSVEWDKRHYSANPGLS
ncbi:unnamed protein product, partial [marine sediment metagenome]